MSYHIWLFFLSILQSKTNYVWETRKILKNAMKLWICDSDEVKQQNHHRNSLVTSEHKKIDSSIEKIWSSFNQKASDNTWAKPSNSSLWRKGPQQCWVYDSMWKHGSWVWWSLMMFSFWIFILRLTRDESSCTINWKFSSIQLEQQIWKRLQWNFLR